MRRFASIGVWTRAGALLIAAAMPYCSAALGWAATQDAAHIYVRADIAVGILIATLGVIILIGCLGAWVVERIRLRGRRARASLSVRARALSRA